LALGSDDSGELFDAVFLISGDNTELFELLEGVSEDLAGRGAVVLSSDAVLSFTTEKVLKSSNAQMRSQVDLSGNSGNSGVKPVGVFRGKFFTDTSLGEFDPSRDDNLVVLLQVFGVSLNEGTGRDVLNGEREIVLKGKHELYLSSV